MNIDNRTKVAIAFGTAALVLSIRDYRIIKKREEAKRAKIREDYNLNVEALNAAANIVAKRIANGEFESGSAALLAFNREVDFQMIAVREK